jgi:hypothetical protein
VKNVLRGAFSADGQVGVSDADGQRVSAAWALLLGGLLSQLLNVTVDGQLGHGPLLFGIHVSPPVLLRF